MGHIPLITRLILGGIFFIISFVAFILFDASIQTAFWFGVVMFLIAMVLGSRALDEWGKERAERIREDQGIKHYAHLIRKGQLEAEDEHEFEKRQPRGLGGSIFQELNKAMGGKRR